MLNIYQRLNEVRKLVDYVKKQKKVENYVAVTHDQVTAVTRKHFIDQGIVIVPLEVESKTVLTGTTSKSGTPALRFESKYRVEFVNMDDPADKACVEVTAHANDYGDKSPGKAVSYAVKTAILKILSLETGEDDESVFAEKEGVTEAFIAQAIRDIQGAENADEARKIYQAAAKECNDAEDNLALARIKEAGLSKWKNAAK